MNWYNRLIKICQTTLDNKPIYTDLGHRPNEESPNYIWYYINGILKVQEQTESIQGHSDILEYRTMGDFRNFYSGRYESNTGNLSLKKPTEGVNAFRDVPSRLISQLYQKFPDITQMYTY